MGYIYCHKTQISCITSFYVVSKISSALYSTLICHVNYEDNTDNICKLMHKCWPNVFVLIVEKVTAMGIHALSYEQFDSVLKW